MANANLLDQAPKRAKHRTLLCLLFALKVSFFISGIKNSSLVRGFLPVLGFVLCILNTPKLEIDAASSLLEISYSISLLAAQIVYIVAFVLRHFFFRFIVGSISLGE